MRPPRAGACVRTSAPPARPDPEGVTMPIRRGDLYAAVILLAWAILLAGWGL
jgi:hypothetical protein